MGQNYCEYSVYSFTFLIILWLIYKTYCAVWTGLLVSRFGMFANKVKWCPSETNWAVITGAGDGIGKAYANQLAKIGYNLLIISRSEDKLNKTKDEILSKHKNCSQIKILAIDLSRTDIYDILETSIRELGDIHVLVNNVGISYTYPEYFTQIPDSLQLIERIINCNIVCMTRLIRLVLPQMEANRSGVIINLSSYSARQPTPLLSVYSASKKYIEFLSRSLHYEYRRKGITIQCVLPMYVTTDMSQIKRTSLFVPDPDAYVAQALRTVGIESITYGYFWHKILAFFQTLIINILGEELGINIVQSMLKNVRKRYFKKYNINVKTQ